MKPNTISLNEVIARIKSHRLLASLNEETIVDWTIEFHRILGVAETFEEKIAILEVKNYRAVLPDDFYEIIQLRTFAGNDEKSRPTYFRSMTDKFYQSENNKNSVPYTYKIQGTVIYLSPMRQGVVEIAYRAIELDDCGLPLIPDNAKYIRALESYIKYKRYQDLFDEGEIKSDVLDRAEQDYCFNVAQAGNDFKMPSFDEMESIGNIVNSMLPRRFSHYRGYADSGSKEFINKG